MTPKTPTTPPSGEDGSLAERSIAMVLAMLGAELEEAELCERFKFRVRIPRDLEDGQTIWDGTDRTLWIGNLNSPYLRPALLWCVARQALGRDEPEGLVDALKERAEWRHAAPSAAWLEAITLDRRQLDALILSLSR